MAGPHPDLLLRGLEEKEVLELAAPLACSALLWEVRLVGVLHAGADEDGCWKLSSLEHILSGLGSCSQQYQAMDSSKRSFSAVGVPELAAGPSVGLQAGWTAYSGTGTELLCFALGLQHQEFMGPSPANPRSSLTPSCCPSAAHPLCVCVQLNWVPKAPGFCSRMGSVLTGCKMLFFRQGKCSRVELLMEQLQQTAAGFSLLQAAFP